jgi:regulator of cell morphogenesis and NO signaling
MENIDKKPIGQIVADNYAVWQVFESHKIDYYNKGRQRLEEVADQYKIDLQTLKSEIEKKEGNQSEENEDFNSWTLDALSDYIVTTYHRYADKQIQVIKPALEKVCGEYGDRHPGLPEIKKLFDEAAGVVAVHQKKEELMLFPFIRKMADAEKNNKAFGRPSATRSVEGPVDMLTHEHHQQSDLFQKIAQLSHDYTLPAGTDGAFKDSLRLLKEFATNLHQHLHLENNILFPKALQLEKELTT